MPLLKPKERAFMESIARIAFGNPFLPERIEAEKEALGSDFDETRFVWSVDPETGDEDRPNVRTLIDRVESLAEVVRQRLQACRDATPGERALYEDLITFLLYRKNVSNFSKTIQQSLTSDARAKRVTYYKSFVRDANHFLQLPGLRFSFLERVPHLFACFFHIRRTFHYIFHYIVGGSLAAARLRAAIWQSAFTHDLRRYRDIFYDRMGDFTTLITGPSGTGKELVARAIGMSRYIPFDPQTQRFSEDFSLQFHTVSLSALSPTLIEAELFGHKRGAFTGAIADRTGWLETCGPLGTVFLDEIGELEVGIQVKLLRALQSRTFQRLGESKNRPFLGKVIAATNRDLLAEMQARRFREDLYYRLCSDMIVTPSLREQLAEDPHELRHLVVFLTRRIAGEATAEALAQEVESWILRHLGPDYPWPGNMRELEQCVRNVLIRKEYRPPQRPILERREEFLRAVEDGTLTTEALLRGYTTIIYAQTGNYEATARRLQLDRRTVKRRVDTDLLVALKTAAR